MGNKREARGGRGIVISERAWELRRGVAHSLTLLGMVS